LAGFRRRLRAFAFRSAERPFERFEKWMRRSYLRSTVADPVRVARIVVATSIEGGLSDPPSGSRNQAKEATCMFRESRGRNVDESEFFDGLVLDLVPELRREPTRKKGMDLMLGILRRLSLPSSKNGSPDLRKSDQRPTLSRTPMEDPKLTRTLR